MSECISEQDIHRVLEGLLLGSVAEQTATVAAYFLPDAAFASSCYRVPSFASLIEFRVSSCVFDRSACVLYLSLQQTLSSWFLPIRSRPIHLVSVLQLRPLDKNTFEPDLSNPVRDATDCGECSTLAGAGEKEEGVLYFISGQRDYCRGEDVAGMLAFGAGRAACRALKALATVVCVVIAVVCMPVYCALWPEWYWERDRGERCRQDGA